MTSQGTVIKGAFLVAGTTIGGGMLAMPILTSLGGFIPSLAIFFFCWVFMMLTGLLYLEACLWMDGDTNVISMATKTLGQWGKAFSWVLYLFLFMTLTLAYVVGCGRLTWMLFDGLIPEWAGGLVFLLIFAPIVYKGAHLVSSVNFYLMGGLIVSYVVFLVMGWQHVKLDHLIDRDWVLSLKILPVAFTAFGYQGLVPSLTRYLDRDKKKVTLSIIIGSFAALVTYVVWHWLILGIVPKEGEHGLLEALAHGDTAVAPLRYALDNPYIYVIGEFFAFFALVTSFLGVTLGLRDFLADGLKIEKNAQGRLFLCLLIFVPVLILSVLYPHVFLEALGYAGGFGGALLLGLLPILIVWSGRYRLGLKNIGIVPGGKAVLMIMSFFVFFEMIVEIFHIQGWF